MSINVRQFKEHIIIPTLKEMGMYSDSAVNLLLGTMAQESHFGTYIKQLGRGPALGVYQMEPNTHTDIVNNFISYRQSIQRVIGEKLGYDLLDHKKLVWDLRYATMFCRLHYYRKPESLPLYDNVPALASYWKRHYNTHLGKGTEEEFIENFNRYIKGV